MRGLDITSRQEKEGEEGEGEKVENLQAVKVQDRNNPISGGD